MRLASVLALVLVGTAIAVEEVTVRLEAAHVKPGQRYVFRRGTDRTSWEILAKTDREVSFSVRSSLGGKELPAQPGKMVLERIEAVGLHEGSRAGKDETLVVSGIAFPCSVTETESGGQIVRTWRSRLFPEVVKVEIAGLPSTSSVVCELAAIESGETPR